MGKASQKELPHSQVDEKLSQLPDSHCTTTSTGEKRHTCSICQKAFRFRYLLHQHLQQHMGRTYNCTECSKTFKTKSGLRSHKNEHLKNYRHICSCCNKGFVYKSDYDTHINIKQNLKPHLCTKCGRAFRKKSGLTEHMFTCQKAFGDFECPICEKKFKCGR